MMQTLWRGYLWWWLHNLIAHPLLVLWPRVGRMLHKRSQQALEVCDPNREIFSELTEDESAPPQQKGLEG